MTKDKLLLLFTITLLSRERGFLFYSQTDFMKHLLGKILIDKDGTECKVIEVTSNSINVWIERKSKKGISCSNWFSDEKRTWERFKIK